MRECGLCSLCCKVPAVKELNKAPDQWCQHCSPGKDRCKIYDDRPQGCRDFTCGWLMSEDVPDFMYPKDSHVVLTGNAEGTGVLALVDDKRPGAWKRRDILAYLSHLSTRMPVCIVVGDEAYQMFPNQARKLDESEVTKVDALTRQYRLRMS